MNFQPNTHMPHLPSSNIHHQSMPVLQSNYINQSALNDESDFMARLVKEVSEELRKAINTATITSVSVCWYQACHLSSIFSFFFILKYQTKVVF